MPDADVSAAEMVLCEEFAGRADAVWLPHIRCRGGSAPAEEFGGMVFFQRMTPPFSPALKQGFFSL